MEVDRRMVRKKSGSIVSAKESRMENCENIFYTSDVEVNDTDNDLLAHLVRDVSEVDFEDVELDTKICDLVASTRKSKKSPKKPKAHKGTKNSKKNVS